MSIGMMSTVLLVLVLVFPSTATLAQRPDPSTRPPECNVPIDTVDDLLHDLPNVIPVGLEGTQTLPTQARYGHPELERVLEPWAFVSIQDHVEQDVKGIILRRDPDMWWRWRLAEGPTPIRWLRDMAQPPWPRDLTNSEACRGPFN